MRGEISAVRSLLSYVTGDAQNAIAYGRQSIEKTAPELWSVRILARQCLGAAQQMAGNLEGAYATVYSGSEEEPEETVQRKRFKATLLVTACDIHWIAANLHEMAQAAAQCLMLSQHATLPEILNFGHYNRGKVCYHHNNLTASEQHFSIAVRQPYLNYIECFAFSSFGLALTYQAQGQAAKAREVAKATTKFLLEAENTYLLPVAQAFEAELALMQGQLATANQWAARLDPLPTLTPIFGIFSPHLTLVKVWLAQDTPVSRGQAADLLEKVKGFVEATHNTRFLIEVLALQALLYDTQEKRETALTLLAQAVELAQPGGFIRLFVDLGPQMAYLLAALKSQDSGLQLYTDQILAAFEKAEGGRRKDEANNIHPSSFRLPPFQRRSGFGQYRVAVHYLGVSMLPTDAPFVGRDLQTTG